MTLLLIGLETSSPGYASTREFLRLACALLVLAVAVYLVQLAILRTPSFGFQLAPRTWEVTRPAADCVTESCPQRGDRLQRIAGVSFERFISDRSLPLPDLRDGQEVEIELLRDGEVRVVRYAQPAIPLALRLATIFSVVLLPLVFWLAGSAALLFLRPLGGRGSLYVALFYSLTVFFAASWSGWAQVGYSWYILRVGLWLVVPLLIHFHLVEAERRFRRGWKWSLPLYLFAAWGLAADLDRAGSSNLVVLALLVAIVVSSGLLVYGWVRSDQPSSQRVCRIMASGLVVGTAPFVMMGVVPSIVPSAMPDYSNPIGLLLGMVAILSIPMWPASYLYVVYSSRDHTLRFRANKWLGKFGYYSLILATFLSLQMIGMRALWTPESSNTGFELAFLLPLIASALLLLAAPGIESRFQRWVDAKVFGIHYQTEEVLRAFARRIPTAMDDVRLRGLVRDEILPTLMIKRSALYLLKGDDVKVIYAGKDDEAPGAQVLRWLALEPHRDLAAPRPVPNGLAWVRLALPVSVDEELLGVWLFGDRDPDDQYPAEDVELLESLANMIGAVAQGQQAAAAKSTFLANISHEIRTPLNGVLGMAGLLANTELDAKQKRYCEAIRSSGERLLRLLDDILHLAKMEAGRLTIRPRFFDVGELLDSVVRRQAALAEAKDLVLEVDEESIRGRCYADAERIAQVLDNLVANAVKFTDAGRITVMAIPSPNRESSLRFSVVDTGIGIADSQLDKIFEKFGQVDSSTTRRHSGTGLGLAICRQLAYLMGGSLGVSSKEGEGSSFWLDLPLVEAEASDGSSDSNLR